MLILQFFCKLVVVILPSSFKWRKPPREQSIVEKMLFYLPLWGKCDQLIFSVSFFNVVWEMTPALMLINKKKKPKETQHISWLFPLLYAIIIKKINDLKCSAMEPKRSVETPSVPFPKQLMQKI